MTNINPPIQPGFPKDRLTVPEIEKLRSDKELQDELSRKSPQAFLMACFCAYIKKMASFLASRPISKGTPGETLRHELLEFKKNLSNLTQKDLSQDPSFAEKLSKTWNALLEATHVTEFLYKKPELLNPLKDFIASFSSYPQKDHSLAFYMSKWAGKDWQPLPFIEMLHGLYEENSLRKSESKLSKWLTSIDSLLVLLK